MSTDRLQASAELRAAVQAERDWLDLFADPADCDGCICGCPCCSHICGVEDEEDQ